MENVRSGRLQHYYKTFGWAGNSNLLQAIVNYGRKNFYDIWSRSESQLGSSSTLPRSVATDKRSANSDSEPFKPDSGSATPDFGSLRRRKTLRSASLGSLLQHRDDEVDDPVEMTRSQCYEKISFVADDKAK